MRRRHLPLRVLGILVILGSVLTASASAHPGHPHGAARADDPSRGQVHEGLTETAWSCGSGLLAIEGTGLCSHGPDAAAPDRDVRKRRSVAQLRELADRLRGSSDAPSTAGTTVPPTDGTGAIVCVGDGVSQNRVQVLYVVASDKPDRFASLQSTLGQYMVKADGQFNASARKTQGVRHLRYVTAADGQGGCRLDIRKVVVPASADDTFAETITAVKAAGHTLASRKYMMFADANVYCGIGSIYNDDSPGQTNANNGRYAQYSRVDNGCWNYAEAHELTHNMGGVQKTAPHATEYYHCWDESDRMCYADGTSKPMRQLCPTSQEGLFDCNGDDYFNTAPSAGTYLATHWNVANSSFLLAGGVVAPPDIAPAPPEGLAASAGSDSVGLTWTAGAESDLAGYRVLRDGVQIASLGKVTAYTDGAVSAGKTYSYTVRAVDAAGNVSTDSSTASATVPEGTPPPPPPPPPPGPIESGSRYRVVNVKSGKAMENPYSSRSTGTQLTQRTVSSTATNQLWTFTADGSSHQLRNGASGLCVDVKRSSTSSGADVVQMTCGSASSQRWTVTPADAGGYTIVARHSGRCLEVRRASTANGAKILQSTCNKASNQRWTFTRVP